MNPDSKASRAGEHHPALWASAVIKMETYRSVAVRGQAPLRFASGIIKTGTITEEAKELVAHLLEEHEEVESGLKAMIDAKKMDHDKFMKIKSEVYEHMRDEENDLFEKAVEGLTQAQLKAKLEPFEKTEESEKEKAL